MALDNIARGMALAAHAKLGNVPPESTVMEIVHNIEAKGYDDTQITQRITTLETEAGQTQEQIQQINNSLPILVTEEEYQELAATGQILEGVPYIIIAPIGE